MDAAIIAGRLSICSNLLRKVMFTLKKTGAAAEPGADGLFLVRNLTS
jgi:hypothetical protein